MLVKKINTYDRQGSKIKKHQYFIDQFPAAIDLAFFEILLPLIMVSINQSEIEIEDWKRDNNADQVARRLAKLRYTYFDLRYQL
jgi:hypothetical protein